MAPDDAIAVRAATVADAAAISALTLTSMQRWIAGDCTAEGAASLAALMTPEATRERLQGDAYRTWVAEIDGALEHHELIKIKAASDEPDTRRAWLEEICTTTGAAPVQQIGKILVIYRAAGKPVIVLPG